MHILIQQKRMAEAGDTECYAWTGEQWSSDPSLTLRMNTFDGWRRYCASYGISGYVIRVEMVLQEKYGVLVGSSPPARRKPRVTHRVYDAHTARE